MQVNQICEATWYSLYIGRENACVRFSCNAGGAMGMNMVSKGVHNFLDLFIDALADMNVIKFSGEFLLYVIGLI